MNDQSDQDQQLQQRRQARYENAAPTMTYGPQQQYPAVAAVYPILPPPPPFGDPEEYLKIVREWIVRVMDRETAGEDEFVEVVEDVGRIEEGILARLFYQERMRKKQLKDELEVGRRFAGDYPTSPGSLD
jgi:hypothetical protein